jgi:hypothetical protein
MEGCSGGRDKKKVKDLRASLIVHIQLRRRDSLVFEGGVEISRMESLLEVLDDERCE